MNPVEENRQENRHYALLREAQCSDPARADAATERLITENMGLVRSAARRFRDRGTEYEDLIQIGTIGMLRAIRTFDLSRNTAFSTFAVPLIVGEIRRHLRDDGIIRVSRSYKQLAAELTAAKAKIEEMALDQAVRTIRNRIDQFGVAEPDIRNQADFRIQIQLPGLTDSKRAIQLVGQTAQLTFHLVRDDVNPQGILPPGVALFPMVTVRPDGSTSESMIALDKEPLMTGEDVADARPTFDNRDNKPSVGLSFNSRGAAMFERITGEHIHKRMAIVLDGKVHSAPTIQSRIGGGKASITGSFTPTEAQDLAIVLRAGSLPAPVTVLEERTVGPSLGKESIESGILAAAVGGIAVMVVMPLYYGLAGLLADVMLVFTITMLMAGLAAFGATLTLPGIAGIVLTIGMSVDANVLIFERIREEIRQGLKPLEAVAVGFDRATISIVDSNLTTIIAAAILYQFGTGPVRGFAVTLSLGIVASMFTAIFVSRTAFGLWLGGNDGKKLSI